MWELDVLFLEGFVNLKLFKIKSLTTTTTATATTKGKSPSQPRLQEKGTKVHLLIATEACAHREGGMDDEHLCRSPITGTMSNENNEYDQFLSQRTCNLVGERMSIQQIFTVDLLQR